MSEAEQFRHCAWHADSHAASHADWFVMSRIRSVAIVFGGSICRCSFAVIQSDGLLFFCVPDHHETAAADSATGWPDHRQCKRCCHSRIDDIAAFAQDFRPGFAGR